MGKYLAVSAKAKHIPTHDPEILLLNKYPREISAYVQKMTWTKMFRPALFKKKKSKKPENNPNICQQNECHNLLIYTAKYYGSRK